MDYYLVFLVLWWSCWTSPLREQQMTTRRALPLTQPSAPAWSSSRYTTWTDCEIVKLVISSETGALAWKILFRIVCYSWLFPTTNCNRVNHPCSPSRFYRSRTPQRSTLRKPTSLCCSVWRWRTRKWRRQPSRYSETRDRRSRQSSNRYDRKRKFTSYLKQL